jgi:hypothetical protein
MLRKTATFTVVSCFLLLSLVADVNCGLVFQVEPKASECFFVDLTPGQKVSVPFFVTRGGLLDIDLRILGPQNEPISSGMQFESSTVDFTVRNQGPHQFCWNNEMARWTAKVVQFDVYVDGKPSSLVGKEKMKAEPVTPGALSPLEMAVNRISDALNQIQKDQHFLRVRETAHRDTAESTNTRVLWYSVLESIVLIGISLGQVYYLRKFFEVKRAV